MEKLEKITADEANKCAAKGQIRMLGSIVLLQIEYNHTDKKFYGTSKWNFKPHDTEEEAVKNHAYEHSTHYLAGRGTTVECDGQIDKLTGIETTRTMNAIPIVYFTAKSPQEIDALNEEWRRRHYAEGYSACERPLSEYR